MKPSAAVKKYCNQRLKAITDFIEQPGKSISAEDYHRLRVEIKKMRAVLSLLNFSSKGFKRKRLEKPFGKVFHRAGLIRELQLEQLMLREFKISTLLKGYASELRKMRAAEQKKFLKLANKKMISRLSESYKEMVPFFEDISQSKADKFIWQKQKQINRVVESKKFKPEQLHKLRKDLKELQYVLKMLPSQSPPKDIDTLQDSLGKWHDKVVVVKQLKKAIKSVQVPPEEVTKLKILRDKLSAERDHLYHEIISGLVKKAKT